MFEHLSTPMRAPRALERQYLSSLHLPAAPASAAGLPRVGFAELAIHPASAPLQLKKKSLRARVREKLQGREELARRDLRFVRGAHYVPTAGALAAGRANLRPADYGVAHPDLRGIRVRRDPGQSPEHYADFLADTRASVRRLSEGPAGRGLLTGLDARTAAVHPGLAGNDRTNPLTVADIHSGRGLHPDSAMSHRVRHNNTYPDVQRGYRYDGHHGAGIASRVNYDESRARPDRFISLGHELVHAHRSAHGYAVSPPEVSPQRGHALLNPPTPAVVSGAIGQHAQLREEFETVGLTPTPRVPNSPTEAAIRAEHGFRARTDYSGLVPGGIQEQTLRNVDAGTDDRSWWDKQVRDKPSPVSAIVKHLEE